MARIKNNEVRQKILKIACEKFINNGYDNVTMKEIAAAAGIYPSLLQHYFSTKDDMLVHIGYSMTKAVFEYAYRTFYEEILSYEGPEDALALNEVLFKRLFYSCMSKNNNKLLKLYVNALTDSRLIKGAIDYTDSNTENSFVPIDSDELRGKRQKLDYVITGVMSQFIVIYEENSLTSLSEFVDQAVDIGLYSIGLSESRRKTVMQYAAELITPEREAECYEAILQSLQEFADCEF